MKQRQENRKRKQIAGLDFQTMLKWFVCRKNVVLGFITKNPKLDPLSKHFSFPISLRIFRYCTTASESDTHPLPVSYLINNFGFSHESALKALNHKKVRFKSPDKPNSVINFFKNHNFSLSNIRIIITKQPSLLSSKPHKTLLPKFQFFLSKGVSSSDIVSLLTEEPRILQTSLEKRIIPLFELLSRFLITNEDVIVCLIRHSYSFAHVSYDLIVANINLMTDFGVSDSVIARLLQTKPSIFSLTDLIKPLEEVKGLGFDPSTITFGRALIAKKCMSKKLWDRKLDTFKKWGWSDKDIVKAFRVKPDLLMASIYKINLVMSFWVNQLGWNSLALTKRPHMFGHSLEKMIIPRASVLQFLLMKCLRNKNASLVNPFRYSEKLFLEKFVFSFKEESDYLLKLYEEKMKLVYTTEHNGMPLTK